MQPSLYNYVWKHSRREQLAVLVFVVFSQPFYFMALTLPKDIVNIPIQGKGFVGEGATQAFFRFVISLPNPVADWLGMPWIIFDGIALERLPMLFALSFTFLTLVCINGLFKMRINTMKGQLGERLLRRLRYELIDRVLRFPPRQFRKIKQSEVASMVKDEVEPLGGFIGDAIVWPVFLGMQALTALTFILLQSSWLGLIAAGVVTIQALVIPFLRKPILRLGKLRQLQARELAGRVGEIVDGAADIHVNDTSNYERAEIANRLGRIYDIRFEIYQRKFFVKFLNNLLAQVTPFIFYALGGYLAITGALDVGQLLAVIVAYKDLPGPIKELIDWDLQRQDVTIKYNQVMDQFHPDGMLDPVLQAPIGYPPPIIGSIELSAVTATDDAGFTVLEPTTLSLPLGEMAAVTGPSGGGKEAFALLFARQLSPSSGAIRINGQDFGTLPEGVTGRRIGYAGPDVYVLSGSLRENLLYGLKNEPRHAAQRNVADAAVLEIRLAEARRAGNPDFDVGADWIDYQAAGARSPEELRGRLALALTVAGLEDDVFQFGLQSRIDPAANPDAAARVLGARQALRSRLQTSGAQTLIESFDPDGYNRNASLAENILFGTSSDPEFAIAALAKNPYVRRAIAAAGLENDLVAMGRSIADTMVELFRDFAPDHPFFEEFSFIPSGELPFYEALLKRARGDVGLLDGNDRERLIALTFRYVEARHRLGLIDDSMKVRVLEARRFIEAMMNELKVKPVDVYEPDQYNAGATLLDNILFGRISFGVAQASERVNAHIREVLRDQALQPLVLDQGLHYQAGTAGKRLSVGQKQKLGLARALIKQPDILVINGALTALDDRQKEEIVGRILKERAGRATLWILSQDDLSKAFTRVLRFEHGRLVSDTARTRLAHDAAQ
jgi:putative ABC transport system ATP-binding protein